MREHSGSAWSPSWLRQAGFILVSWAGQFGGRAVGCPSSGYEDEMASALTRLCISGYRSLRDVRLELDPLTVVTGANGSGKSSLYRALRLLADIAQGRIIESLAIEGGLPSALWAGPESF